MLLQDRDKSSKKRRASDSDMTVKDPHSVRQGAVRPRRELQALVNELQSINQTLVMQQARLLESENVLIR